MFAKPPAPALWLGYLGLIPFYATAFGIWFVLFGASEMTPAVSNWLGFLFLAHMTYAALILTFLGAVHWGLAMANMGWQRQKEPDPTRWDDGGAQPARFEPAVRQMLWSVVPAILAWVVLIAFQFLPIGWLALLVMIGLYIAVWIGDSQAARYDLAPGWYMKLRSPVTWLAVGAMVITLLATI
jgi:hypothetical protein